MLDFSHVCPLLNIINREVELSKTRDMRHVGLSWYYMWLVILPLKVLSVVTGMLCHQHRAGQTWSSMQPGRWPLSFLHPINWQWTVPYLKYAESISLLRVAKTDFLICFKIHVVLIFFLLKNTVSCTRQMTQPAPPTKTDKFYKMLYDCSTFAHEVYENKITYKYRVFASR